MSTADFLADVLALSPDYFHCADAGVTVTGSGVSAWLDQSGAAHTASQGTDAKRPPFVAADATLNGRASLTHNGTAQGLLVAAGLGWPAGTSHHVMMVLNQGSSVAIECLMDTQTGRWLLLNQAPGYLVGASDGTYRTVAANITGPQTVEWRLDDPADLIYCYRNGAALGSAAWPTSRTIGGAVSYGGNYLLNGTYFKGSLACVIGWASLLSAPNVAAVRAAIKSYYGFGVMT